MEQILKKLQKEAEDSLRAASKETEVLEIKSRFLGKKGSITTYLRRLSEIPPQERPKIGRLINQVKDAIEKTIQKRLIEIREAQKRALIEKEKIDLTLPGRRPPIGRLHPITQISNRIIEIFTSLGFQVAEGPEVELDFYNFEALNIPKDHPARDMHDTFYIAADVLLRTHTSPVQIRVMENFRPPMKIISIGRVYRCDSDISHSPMFHQAEGFMVDKEVTFSDLKGILSVFVQEIFGKDTRIRFRPSFFPFTEPSAEVDIECRICKGKGCRVCGESGWIEILGSGMIHPQVFRSVNYDPNEYTGFAFGMGIERIAMIKYGIDNIRLFFENDLRFLVQF